MPFRLLVLLFWLVAGAPLLMGQADDSRAEFERRSRQEKVGGKHIPADLQDAMRTLDALTSEDSKFAYSEHGEDEAVQKLFFSFGRWIAINWGLYDGSRFSAYLRRIGVDQPDGQKEFIMRAYHRHLRGVDLDVADLAGRYKAEKARQDSIQRAKAQVIKVLPASARDSTVRG